MVIQPIHDPPGHGLPAGFQHHIVGHIRENFGLRGVGPGRGPHLAGRKNGVGLAAQHQHGRLDSPGAGQLEREHAQESQVRLVLQAGEIGRRLLVRHGGREKELPRPARCAHERIQAQRQVGLEKGQRITGQHLERGAQHARGGDRGQQHGRRGRVGFQIFLDHQPTHRVTNQHRRRGQLSGDLGHVGHVMGDARPAQALAAVALAVAAQAQRVAGVAAFGEIGHEMLGPAPRPVPGAVHEQQRGWAWVGWRLARHHFEFYRSAPLALRLTKVRLYSIRSTTA